VSAAAWQERSWLWSWELFGDVFLVGALLASVLPMLGVVLLLRQQLFLAASIGQAANGGIAVAIWAGLGAAHSGGHGGATTAAAIAGQLAAMLTAVFAMRALSARASTLEARNALVFLGAGSGAMVLLADAPHGLAEVQRLFLSSLLCAGPHEVWVAAAFTALAVMAVVGFGGRLWLWAMDPASAQVYGSSVRRWDVLIGCCAGSLLGFAIQASGLLFTFGCAVLPVLCVRELAPSLRAVVCSAPIVGAVLFVAGFAVANRCDLPPGQAVVAVMAAATVVARALAAARRLTRGWPARAP
jgi:zinc transport system permease protein